MWSQFRDWKLLNQFSSFCYPNNLSKLVVYCLKFILKLFKNYESGTKLYQNSGNTKIIISIQQLLSLEKPIK